MLWLPCGIKKLSLDTVRVFYLRFNRPNFDFKHNGYILYAAVSKIEIWGILERINDIQH